MLASSVQAQGAFRSFWRGFVRNFYFPRAFISSPRRFPAAQRADEMAMREDFAAVADYLSLASREVIAEIQQSLGECHGERQTELRKFLPELQSQIPERPGGWPDPELFAQLNELAPGSIERVFERAESIQSRAFAAMRRSLRAETLGYFSGLALVLSILICCIGIIIIGHNLLGVGLLMMAGFSYGFATLLAWISEKAGG